MNKIIKIMTSDWIKLAEFGQIRPGIVKENKKENSA